MHIASIPNFMKFVLLHIPQAIEDLPIWTLETLNSVWRPLSN